MPTRHRRITGQYDPLVRTALSRKGGSGSGVTAVTGTPPITSTGGDTPAIGITAASEAAAGSMSAADKTKLDGIAPGAAVSAVTGTAPIVSSGGDTPAISITPATEAAAGSMSAADKTKLDGLSPTSNAWTYNTPIPASVVSPELAQAQALAGAGQSTVMRSQAAATGSGLQGGSLFFTLGKSEDGLVTGTALFGSETVVGGSVPPTTNYFGALDLTWHQGSGVVIANFGRGTNGTGGGVAGVEISAFSEMSLATEGSNSIINLQPASSFGGQSFISAQQDPTTGLPVLVLTESPGDPQALSGIIRLAWDNSGTAMGLVVQRDIANANDLEILSRHLNELYFGSFLEDNRYHSRTQVLFEIFAVGGAGWVFQGPLGGAMTIGTNANKTVKITSSPTTKDAAYQEIYAATTTSTTATQPLNVGVPGIILPNGPAPAGYTTKLACNVQGTDETTGQFSSFRIAGTFNNTAGVLTASTTPNGIVTDADHSAAAAAVAPIFQIMANVLTIFVTPWTANSIHWVVTVDNGATNTGTF